ncbi:hypothetical protein Pyrde_1423 [Pyrodictium delaneyi]|uniref:Uncharacterized protein n=1 Tax=Pyrodictium delaneyi TaxID=1273541 RepID=A0A0P0N4G5_9CREN|nr:hypothetical protein [Pyrodictium delaneyi]ALL01467.1 hypothetical protein Pyrde_1423 [Pyrodictium delaneyi]OWJ54618.1 hypothetical protein Pdsh_06245 [Pyrodictium delaneyi]
MSRLLVKLKTLIMAWRLKRIVWGLERRGRYSEAEEKLLQLLGRVEKWSDSPKKHEVIAFIKMRLANIESYKGNYDRALAYASEALWHAEHAGSTIEVGQAYLVEAAIYYNMGELDKACESLAKAQVVLMKGDKEPYLQTYAWSKLLESRILLAKGDREGALKALHEAKELSTRVKHREPLVEKIAETEDRINKVFGG